MRSRAIYGCAGTVLEAAEREFFPRGAAPWGFILFARNIVDREQIARADVAALRETVNDARAPVLIDQEGGRVARLKAARLERAAGGGALRRTLRGGTRGGAGGGLSQRSA